MKLLFDQNISPRLVEKLAHLFPDSVHVYLIGLDHELDRIIWEYARDNDFIIVTKDADFSEISLLEGFPPKVIWIRRGNCSTNEIEIMLRRHYGLIESLSHDPTEGVLILF
jgi:predicted nuclease of predicted toxin-antitoxin system